MTGTPYRVRVSLWLRRSTQAYATGVLAASRRPGSHHVSSSTQHARPRRRAHPHLLVPLAVAATLLMALAAFSSGDPGFFVLHEAAPGTLTRTAPAPPASPPPASATPPATAGLVALFQPAPLRYDFWYQADLRHLQALAKLPLPARFARLRAEERQLAAELARLDRTGAYVDPRGFRVYGPGVTGSLHALGLARRNRQKLLQGTPVERLTGPGALATFGGYHLYPTLQSKLVSEGEVVDALRGLRLPDPVLAGYRVYLLPGSLGDVSGLGGPGYALLGAEPLVVRLVAHQAASTVTHEFGHHLSLSRLGGHLDEAPREWRRYLNLRHIPAWRDDGDVKSEAWARSPEETLAEDVRVLFGTAAAASLPYDAGYGDPRRDPKLRRAVESFLRQLAARPAKSLDRSPAPWLDDLAAGLAPGDNPSAAPLSPWITPRRLLTVLLFLVAAGGLFFIWRTARLARRPGIPAPRPRVAGGSR